MNKACCVCGVTITRVSTKGQPPKRCAACRAKVKPNRGATLVDRPCVDCGQTILAGTPGATRRCQECNRVNQNRIKRSWRLDHKEEDAAIHKRYRASNKDAGRDYHLRKTFGITLADYNKRLEDQSGRCDICGADKPGGKGSWHVDHDHATGAVRGLLCLRCNALLGHARDDESILERAIMYLRRHGLGIRIARCG